MQLVSIYLIVNDFQKSVDFYEKILQIPVTSCNMDRFAMFSFEGQCISLMNGHFDTDNPDKVVHKGEQTPFFDNLKEIATATNTQKFVLNFGAEDLKYEYNRIKNLYISKRLTKIKYVCNVTPYYYFQFTDPDDNVIEVTGSYTPNEGEFD